MTTHVLKTDPLTFDAVVRGEKTHEIRYNDRDYQVGDKLVLRKTKYSANEMKCYEQATLQYTGDEITRTVTHILEGYGLMPGWVILSIASEVPASITDVSAERIRQIRVEGYTPEHDYSHVEGHLAVAGACYALSSTRGHYMQNMPDVIQRLWPFADDAYKQKKRREDLVRGAALICAEIDLYDQIHGSVHGKAVL